MYQEKIKSRARTKRGSKIINVRVFLLAAQMNSETHFSIAELDQDLFSCPVSMCWIPGDVTTM